MSSGRFSVIFALALAWRAAAADFSVAPAHVYLRAGSDAIIEQVLTVTSAGAEDVAFRFAAGAFDLDENGLPLAGHASAQDLSSRIELSDSEATVPAAGKVELHLRIRAPSSPGTAWAAIYIEHVERNVTTRIAVPLFVATIGDEHAKASVSILTAYRAAPGRVVVIAAVHNDGPTVIRAPMSASIETGDGVEVAADDREAFVVLPGGRRVIALTFDGPFEDVSKMKALLFFRFGPDSAHRVTASAQIEIAKPQRPLHTV